MEEKISMEDRYSAEEAVGLLEVFGLVCAFMAADAGCKAADVRLEVFDKNKPANADALPVPLLVTVKCRGSCHGGGRGGGQVPHRGGAAPHHSQAHRGYGKDAEDQRVRQELKADSFRQRPGGSGKETAAGICPSSGLRNGQSGKKLKK